MFFFTQILIKTDGIIGGRGTSDYANIDLAEQAFHNAMVSAISKEDIKKAIMFVYDENGVMKFKRIWTRNE